MLRDETQSKSGSDCQILHWQNQSTNCLSAMQNGQGVTESLLRPSIPSKDATSQETASGAKSACYKSKKIILQKNIPN